MSFPISYYYVFLFTLLPFYFFTFPYFTADNLAIISIIAA